MVKAIATRHFSPKKTLTAALAAFPMEQEYTDKSRQQIWKLILQEESRKRRLSSYQRRMDGYMRQLGQPGSEGIATHEWMLKTKEELRRRLSYLRKPHPSFEKMVSIQKLLHGGKAFIEPIPLPDSAPSYYQNPRDDDEEIRQLFGDSMGPHQQFGENASRADQSSNQVARNIEVG